MVSFNPGDEVIVRHVQVAVQNGRIVGRVKQPEFTGTVVNYWRNGYWIVREHRGGTTCAYPASELAPANG